MSATSRFSLVSRAAIHLAHAARADQREDFVRAEASAGGQRHNAPDERLALIVVVAPSVTETRSSDLGGPALAQESPADQRTPDRGAFVLRLGFAADLSKNACGVQVTALSIEERV